MSKKPGWIGTTLNLFRTMWRFMFSKNDIHVESAKENLENLRTLLTHNPELVNLIDRMDYGTPLHWAALYGQAESCKMLLEHGADLKLVDDLGYSPLRWAVDGGEPGIVALLIANPMTGLAKSWSNANGSLPTASAATPPARSPV